MATFSKRKRPRSSGEVVAKAYQDGTTQEEPHKKRKLNQTRTLFVRSLAPSITDTTLTEFFSQHYPVKHATVVLDTQTKASRGYGFVTFADAEDTQAAAQQLQNAKLEGKSLQLEVAQPRRRDPEHGDRAAVEDSVQLKEKRKAALAEERKPPKLIIRNLPWSIKTPDQLGALFQSFGKIKYVDLPQSKGKLSGFGFVTIRGKTNAERAIGAVNGKVVDGRTLAVDFAVDKSTWNSHKQGTSRADEAQAEEPTTKERTEDDQTSKSRTGDEEEDDDMKAFAMNYLGDLESEDEDDGIDDKEEEGQKEEGNHAASTSERDQLSTRMTTDNSSTIFVRNLPFTTTDEQLKSHFSQFGPVRYARVVHDRSTDRPAGTGFVCFFNVLDSKACLREGPRSQPSTMRDKKSILQDDSADAGGRYTLDGRVLHVAQAVSHHDAEQLSSASAKKTQAHDKRHLYLLSEGTIPKSSPQYGMLAPSEVKMREASLSQRRKLVQSNPSLHLSLHRLALRNIPGNIDSKELKAIARQAVVGFAKDVKEGRRQPLSKDEVARGGDTDKESEHRRRLRGKGVVKQAKVVFENKGGSKVPEEGGGGKSRGYGFIEYSSHRWALMGLRWLNGHAVKNAGGKSQRLIVEFAIENAQVVSRRSDMERRAGEIRRVPGNMSGRAVGHKKRAGKTGVTGSGATNNGDQSQSREEENKTPAVEQHIIARKRFMRKKKGAGRG